MDVSRRYFYVCVLSAGHLKLGITTRPLGHRLNEYITSDPYASYFKVVRFADITVDELMTIEKQCLDATNQWFRPDVRARKPNNECRHDVAANVLWQHIAHLLSSGIEVIGDELALLGQDCVDGIKQPPEHKENKEQDEKVPDIRTRVQAEYISDIAELLKIHKRALMKAPTGFGKTKVYYGIINALDVKRVLILTPRINLCRQLTDQKYLLAGHGFEISHLSGFPCLNDKTRELRRLAQYPKILVTACYQSASGIENAFKNGFANLGSPSFDLIIFDEAHAISKLERNDSLLTDMRLAAMRLFGSATPTERLETNSLTYGPLVEKIHVYELINAGILCNIATLVKRVDPRTAERSEYCNMTKLIENGMDVHHKHKGIVYANSRANAYEIQKAMSSSKIRAFIYVSNGNDGRIYDQLSDFEACKTPCVLIAVGMISYGYDNPDIDFICLADPRYSDVDIRQIVGRGLRWDHAGYPDKVLHILVPLYPDEFGKCRKNESLQKYLCYVIGECGSDLVLKHISGDSGLHNSSRDSQTGVVAIYDGDVIESCLYDEYCTGLWNSFTNFQRLLRANHAWDEKSYNELREKYSWVPLLEDVRKKYPSFCFMSVHPNSHYWYRTRDEADTAQKLCRINLAKQKGRMNPRDIVLCMQKMDTKLPRVDFDLYYPSCSKWKQK